MKHQEDGILIGLIGVTGAGKTTFASIASGQTDLKIGNTLRSCTQEPQVVKFEVDGRSIIMVDTPGFDDDERSDVEILESIAEWLSMHNFGRRNLLLDGLILLHPITANRVGGTERKRTRLLQTILGENAYKRVIIATTMWDDLRDDDGKFAHRMQGRIDNGEVWSEMHSKGAAVLRHDNTKESAHQIVRLIIQKSDAEKGGVELQLQKELVDVKGKVSRTTVGKEVKQDLKNRLQSLNNNLKDLDSNRPQPQVGHLKSKETTEWEENRQDVLQKIANGENELRRLNKLVTLIHPANSPSRLKVPDEEALV
ncbi:P-loop containing nucleoside triphosphate hydrolase protein [Lasiosphaeria hispida]|uniref:P-loop containing nucleoside triphosphate hydrolase protein n=1 Tax=Lasiosphaeria hispida TaxID=260671 RepID=A0AAJ0HN51_9PEZI|nr:P-loop containing nucleoside triphosphate hydrolase protein [Lasiosphaeria hispida]